MDEKEKHLVDKFLLGGPETMGPRGRQADFADSSCSATLSSEYGAKVIASFL